jgi:hypothetical protein
MAVAAATLIPVCAGVAGFVVDLGRVMVSQNTLRADVDLAALAGAKQINCCASAPGTAKTTANQYAALNAPSGLKVTTTVSLYCSTTIKAMGGLCTGPDAANAIVVQDQASVPLVFGSIFGVNSVTLTATATASGVGGAPPPLNVMIVLDTTASMNNSDPNCTSVTNATRLTCGLAGIRAVLAQLWDSVDQVGLIVFPGLANKSYVGDEYCSPKGTVQTAPYNASPVYTIISQSNDFRGAGTPPPAGLNSSSELVTAVGGASSCSGVQAPGGQGTFMADAIAAAQSALVASQKTGQQNVMFVVSDGDSNASSSKVPSGEAKNQCHEAITQAQNAAKAGTWVYSLAYGSSTSPTPGSCSTDSPAISACSTMQQIASDSSKFYSDSSGTTSSSNCSSGNLDTTDLVSLFQTAGTSLLGSRLIPNNTP